MTRLGLIVLGLVLSVGLLSPSAGASGLPAAGLTGDSLGEVSPSVSLPEGASAGWWASVQEDIGRSEYRVSWQDNTYLSDLAAAYQAPNRAQNLRTYFTPEGIRATPRTGDSAAWEWGFTLAGYGY